MKNPTLTKNMPHVKWKEIPPIKGPNSQGTKPAEVQLKKWKTVLTVSKDKKV